MTLIKALILFSFDSTIYRIIKNIMSLYHLQKYYQKYYLEIREYLV